MRRWTFVRNVRSGKGISWSAGEERVAASRRFRLLTDCLALALSAVVRISDTPGNQPLVEEILTPPKTAMIRRNGEPRYECMLLSIDQARDTTLLLHKNLGAQSAAKIQNKSNKLHSVENQENGAFPLHPRREEK